METYNKKELQKKRKQKQKEKEERKAERKANAKSGQSLESMMAYVDENGNISTTPPDELAHKRTVALEDIVTGSRNTGSTIEQFQHGIVEFFNASKGFGFIREKQSGEKFFVHHSAIQFAVKDNDKVIFERERGPRGWQAKNVKLA